MFRSFILTLSLILVACGQDPGKEQPKNAEDSTGVVSEGDPEAGENVAFGKELYKENCQGCHGLLQNSTKAGRSAEQITAPR